MTSPLMGGSRPARGPRRGSARGRSHARPQRHVRLPVTQSPSDGLIPALGVDVEVILTCLCIFCMENHY
jgi:hypothetical protein